VAKNLVAAGIAEECEVHLSYTIGKSGPISIDIDTFETGIYPDEKIREVVRELFDLRPAAIMRQFRLRHLPSVRRDGFYRKIATYGQVGRMDIGLPWERTDRTDDLIKSF
jgi:S-adenosylmethionine synthetase